MSRRSDGLTGELFAGNQIPRPAPLELGSMDYRTQVAVLFAEMLKEAERHDPDLDRPMIALQISRLTGKDVSKAMLDGYTAESRDTFNVPLWLAPAAEAVCNSTALSSWFAALRGARLVLGPAALDAEIGRLQNEVSESQDRLRELRALRRSVR